MTTTNTIQLAGLAKTIQRNTRAKGKEQTINGMVVEEVLFRLGMEAATSVDIDAKSPNGGLTDGDEKSMIHAVAGNIEECISNLHNSNPNAAQKHFLIHPEDADYMDKIMAFAEKFTRVFVDDLRASTLNSKVKTFRNIYKSAFLES